MVISEPGSRPLSANTETTEPSPAFTTTDCRHAKTTHHDSYGPVVSSTYTTGAAAVFETAAETPPMRKSIAKLVNPFSAGACTKTGDAFAVIDDRSMRAADWCLAEWADGSGATGYCCDCEMRLRAAAALMAEWAVASGGHWRSRAAACWSASGRWWRGDEKRLRWSGAVADD
nr:Cytochrome 82A4 [Ipomoea batatas]